MRYFIDTEFIEDGNTIDLLSMGIVSEDNRTLYLQPYYTDWSKANEWVKENVIPNLIHIKGDHYGRYSKQDMVDSIVNYIGFDKPEFWGYYCAYDWVALCQLFGTMMDLPRERYNCPYCGEKCPSKDAWYCAVGLCNVTPIITPGWPMYCNDIKQLCMSVGNPRLPKQEKNAHNALADAKWNKEMFEYLVGYHGAKV